MSKCISYNIGVQLLGTESKVHCAYTEMTVEAASYRLMVQPQIQADDTLIQP
jgi:hypothetical protein